MLLTRPSCRLLILRVKGLNVPRCMLLAATIYTHIIPPENRDISMALWSTYLSCPYTSGVAWSTLPYTTAYCGILWCITASYGTEGSVLVYTYIYIHTHTRGPVHPSIHPSIHPFTYSPIHSSTYPYLPTYLPTYLPIFLSIYLPTYLPTYLSTCLSMRCIFCRAAEFTVSSMSRQLVRKASSVAMPRERLELQSIFRPKGFKWAHDIVPTYNPRSILDRAPLSTISRRVSTGPRISGHGSLRMLIRTSYAACGTRTGHEVQAHPATPAGWQHERLQLRGAHQQDRRPLARLPRRITNEQNLRRSTT